MDTEFLDIKDIRLHIGKLLLLLTANVRIKEKITIGYYSTTEFKSK